MYEPTLRPVALTEPPATVRETGLKKKLSSQLRFPELLDVSEYVRQPQGSVSYRLQAVLLHKGPSAYSGHYTGTESTTQDTTQVLRALHRTLHSPSCCTGDRQPTPDTTQVLRALHRLLHSPSCCTGDRQPTPDTTQVLRPLH